MKKLTLYHESSSGSGFKQWSIWMEKDKKTVTVEYGKVGGKLSTSSDTAKPKGKEGTASYVDEYESAKFNMDRQIRKKREEGYRETMDDAEVLDLFSGLTKRFVPAKPRADMELAELRQMWVDNKLVAQRKRNGQRHLVLITNTGDVRIYSRRMDDMTGHFPLLCEEIKSLKLPKKTILDGEIYIERGDGTDDFKAVSTITRAKADKGAQREAYLIRSLHYMVFDILYCKGKPAWQERYHDRYQMLINYFDVVGTVHYAALLDGQHQVFDSLMKHAKADKWEGLVFWFADEPTVVRDGGKPKRAGCAKWKVKVDYDVIATGWYYGSGNRSDVVGGFNLAEYDEDGNLRSCGNCGSGLNMETAKDAMTWDYPLVIKIECDGQEPTGKFIFPVFIDRHEDKLPEECVGQDLSELE